MTEPRLTGTKHCNHCDRDLPVICFRSNSHNKDGLRGEGRECEKKIRTSIQSKKRKLHTDFYSSGIFNKDWT